MTKIIEYIPENIEINEQEQSVKSSLKHEGTNKSWLIWVLGGLLLLINTLNAMSILGYL